MTIDKPLFQRNILMLTKREQFDRQMHLALNLELDENGQSSQILYDPNTEEYNCHSGYPKSSQYDL